jgi:hypothetical protein
MNDYQQFNNMQNQNAQTQQMMMQQMMQLQAQTAQAQTAQAHTAQAHTAQAHTAPVDQGHASNQNNGHNTVFTPISINPRNVNRQNKDATINRNIFLSGYGTYQMCPHFPSIRVKYQKEFNRGNPNTICKVFVKHSHALDIVGSLSNKGLTELKTRKPYPVIINPMYRDFNGNNAKSDDAMPDENIILRTNFAFVVQRQENLFPVTSDSEIVYANPITAIRDQYYNEIPHENLYRTGVICVTPQQPDLIEKVKHDGDRYEKSKVLSSKHFFKFQTQIETAFQVAAKGGHNSVVISIFDQEFGIPVDDQITIYNYCILKYGHLFNAIIFGIPPYQPQDLVEYIDENIMKPQKITADVEMKVAEAVMNKTYEEKIVNGIDDDKPEQQNVSAMTDSEKMEYMKKKIQNKRKEMKAMAEKAMAEKAKAEKAMAEKAMAEKANSKKTSKTSKKSKTKGRSRH